MIQILNGWSVQFSVMLVFYYDKSHSFQIPQLVLQLPDLFFPSQEFQAFIVNTARGKIINEKDLVSALRRRIISGAALDVFDFEPVGKNHPLVKMQNVVLAPHIGSSTVETRKKMAELTVKNLKLALAGKKPIYSV